MKGDKKTILAAVLIIAAIGVVAYQLLGSATSSTKGASSAIAAPTPAPIQAASAVQSAAQAAPQKSKYEQLIASVSERQLAYRSAEFRNPMSPLVSEASASIMKAEGATPDMVTKGYSIKGIIWNEANPLALVNDQVVGVGDSLDDGGLVTEINPNSVKFTKRGNRYVLVLREE